jgi:hypothetical protein
MSSFMKNLQHCVIKLYQWMIKWICGNDQMDLALKGLNLVSSTSDINMSRGYMWHEICLHLFPGQNGVVTAQPWRVFPWVHSSEVQLILVILNFPLYEMHDNIIFSLFSSSGAVTEPGTLWFPKGQHAGVCQHEGLIWCPQGQICCSSSCCDLYR